jgi:hypothetical protein
MSKIDPWWALAGPKSIPAWLCYALIGLGGITALNGQWTAWAIGTVVAGLGAFGLFALLFVGTVSWIYTQRGRRRVAQMREEDRQRRVDWDADLEARVQERLKNKPLGGTQTKRKVR